MTLQEQESLTTLSGPQTTAKRTREVKKITQDHADIMVYKSSPNTSFFIYTNLSSLLESETNIYSKNPSTFFM